MDNLELKRIANEVRKGIITGVHAAKAGHPGGSLSAAEIFRQLKDKGSVKNGQLSESTVLRFINQMELVEQLTNNQDMRRYERPHINEVWCGDSSAGPWLKTEDGKKHRVYVIALIVIPIKQCGKGKLTAYCLKALILTVFTRKPAPLAREAHTA